MCYTAMCVVKKVGQDILHLYLAFSALSGQKYEAIVLFLNKNNIKMVFLYVKNQIWWLKHTCDLFLWP